MDEESKESINGYERSFFDTPPSKTSSILRNRTKLADLETGRLDPVRTQACETSNDTSPQRPYSSTDPPDPITPTPKPQLPGKAFKLRTRSVPLPTVRASDRVGFTITS